MGLLRKAEEIVSQVHSTKKNWPVFSEEAAGFARDFFWSERAAFFRAFPVLVRFLILAAERTDPLDRNKPVANYFDLLDLLFEQEGDTSGLRPLAELWVDALTRSSIDPAPHGRRIFESLKKIHSTFPAIDVGGAVQLLINALAKAQTALKFPAEAVLAPLAALLPPEDFELLKRFGGPGQRLILQSLDGAQQRLRSGDARGALDLISRIDFDVLDERKAVELLFDITERDVTADTAGPLIDAVAACLAAVSERSARVLETVSTSTFPASFAVSSTGAGPTFALRS